MTFGIMTTFEEKCALANQEIHMEEKCKPLNFYVEIETDVGADLNIDVEGRTFFG